MTLDEVIERFPEMSPREQTEAIFAHVFDRQLYPTVEGYLIDGSMSTKVPERWSDTWECSGAIIERMEELGFSWHANFCTREDDQGERDHLAGFWGVQTPDGGIVDCDFISDVSIHEAIALAALRAMKAREAASDE